MDFSCVTLIETNCHISFPRKFHERPLRLKHILSCFYIFFFLQIRYTFIIGVPFLQVSYLNFSVLLSFFPLYSYDLTLYALHNLTILKRRLLVADKLNLKN